MSGELSNMANIINFKNLIKNTREIADKWEKQNTDKEFSPDTIKKLETELIKSLENLPGIDLKNLRVNITNTEDSTDFLKVSIHGEQIIKSKPDRITVNFVLPVKPVRLVLRNTVLKGKHPTLHKWLKRKLRRKTDGKKC